MKGRESGLVVTSKTSLFRPARVRAPAPHERRKISYDCVTSHSSYNSGGPSFPGRHTTFCRTHHSGRYHQDGGRYHHFNPLGQREFHRVRSRASECPAQPVHQQRQRDLSGVRAAVNRASMRSLFWMLVKSLKIRSSPSRLSLAIQPH